MRHSKFSSLVLLMLSNPADASSIASVPLFLTQAIQPAVMLNIPKDSHLFKRLYDDASDLNADGVTETGYTHSFDYPGYFDPYKCYGYQNQHFYPTDFADPDKYCHASWSGNFLNWASMTRIDLIRKLIYGGMRSSDTASYTILERSYIPPDGHSFAKYYQGNDLKKLTPFNFNEGITLCNVTQPSSFNLSQYNADPPLIRLAKGNYALWAANERWQCQWLEERHDQISAFMPNQGSNGHQAAQSGWPAKQENPSNSTLSPSSLQAKVQVCVDDLIDPQRNSEHCKLYGSGIYKPTGLLQQYGDDERIYFGLMTGSYQKNKSGGILRKNISSVRDEIDAHDGHFKSPPATGSIIDSLNKLTIYGLNLQTNLYFGIPDSAACIWGIDSFDDGMCQNSGNPQSEILLEALRYLSGNSPNPEFNADDSHLIQGLKTSAWIDPVPADQWCRSLNVVQLNAGAASYDSDQLSQAQDLGLSDLNGQTDQIGVNEAISGNMRFIGALSDKPVNDRVCTAKAIDRLSAALGICTQSPGLEGGYQIAGLAHYAQNNDIRNDRQDSQTVNFYGIDLAKDETKINVHLQSGDINIIPTCINNTVSANCMLMDLKVLSQDNTSGKFYIVWEDSQQGGDFDSDMNGIISYKISNNTLTVSTQIISFSSSFSLGFGYVISGSNQDGFHAHSGIHSFQYDDPSGVSGCHPCESGDGASQWTYSRTGNPATLMQTPLFYASKWGEIKDNHSVWDSNQDGIPDRYADILHFSKFDTLLDDVFQNAAQTYASSTSLAISSNRLSSSPLIYQARFNSQDWSGQLLAYQIDQQGAVSTTPIWDAAALIPSFKNRKIFSFDNEALQGIAFQWTHGLTLKQRKKIDFANAHSNSSPIMNYITGDQSQELKQGGTYRDRTRLLGDIVHSNPLYVGIEDYGYAFLKGAEGTDYASAFRASNAYQNRKKMVYLGANDGMLHGFDALNGAEVFAYVPSYSLDKLKLLSQADYGGNANPHQYFVDGVAKAGDVYINLNGVNQWKTILIGSSGAGGQGIFALDITDPANFDQNDVLWEFSQDNDLGYTLPEPAIARLANGRWAAILANGYESSNHKAVLFIIDMANGQVIQKIDTGVGSQAQPNGLSTPIVIDADGDLIADAIYAGDLQGNLWKFDITCQNQPSCEKQWGISTPNQKPLFVAKDDSGNVQAITSKPQVGLSNLNQSSFMVYFGTGQYFAVGDHLTPATPTNQSFYAILDNGGLAVSKSALLQQSILAETSLGNASVRITSNNPIDYKSQKGWYMNLTAPGERVIGHSLLRGGRIIFPTLIPASDSCSFGGASWLMELDAFTGGPLSHSPFDLTGPSGIADGIVDDKDMASYHNESTAVSGKKSSIGMIGTPSVISNENQEYKYTSSTSGAVEKTTESKAHKTGRVSWQQFH